MAAFAADAAFSDDANQIAGKILEYLCFHKADDAIPFVVLRLDATTVAAGETWDEKNAREKAARDAAAAERSEAAQRQRATDKAGGGSAEASAPSAAPDARQASTQRSLDAAASRDAANARAQAAADARNAAARERKAALEAASGASRRQRRSIGRVAAQRPGTINTGIRLTCRMARLTLPTNRSNMAP